MSASKRLNANNLHSTYEVLGMSSSRFQIKVLWIHLTIMQKACQLFNISKKNVEALHTPSFSCESKAFTHINVNRVNAKKAVHTWYV